MDEEEIRRRVVQLVREKAPESDEPDSAGQFVLLGDDGMFDSVSALDLILAIEREFAIVVKDDEVRPGNLRDVECIVNFVKSALSRVSENPSSA